MVFQGSQSSALRGITGFGDAEGVRLPPLDDDNDIDDGAALQEDLADLTVANALGILLVPDDVLGGGLRSTNRGC